MLESKVTPVSFHLHRATRTDLLAEGLAGVLAVPAGDPFAQELVVVPAKGVERWLTQRLSHRLGARSGDDGVCAGVRFLSPNSLVTLLLGTDRDDPWLPERLVWPLLATIDESLDLPWASQLAAHLGHGDDSVEGRLRAGRRYSVARRIAGLFHAYAVQRPALLLQWSAGGEWTDGAGGALDEDLAWQPHLWRSLTARVPAATPPVRHQSTVAALRRGDADLDLPARLSLFGHTRLARTEVELLGALATHREVHLWLPHPSPTLWHSLAAVTGDGPVARAGDRSVLSVRHPLLASLGRDVREVQRQLALAAPWQDESLASDDASKPASWLHWLQADLIADRDPSRAEAAGRGISAADRSIQVHACHGAARQVEVLREVLLGLLEDDPTLEPRDILIMCPDIDTYAPLMHATFGLADLRFDGPAHPGHGLRVQLADRSRIFTNPLLAIAARLVELVTGRLTVSEVLDLAATEPVRRRFAFDDDALDRLAQWIDQANIRWGLDGRHRGDFSLADLQDNTWRLGLDRLLLGVTRAEEPHRRYEQMLPLDDVDSASIDLAGRVTEFVDRIAALREACLDASTAAGWLAALSEGIEALTETPLADIWQKAELDREFAAVSEAGHGAIPLSHSDIRTLLSSRLESRATRANFRTGSLTVCTMTPMRSVPHRVVALIGLDDGIFPRTNSPDGDDVLARSPQTGERDYRSEDRQLLLDAILAATDTLVLTYTGADPHTGASRPPSVPLGEVIDAARRTAGLDVGAGSPVRRHRLQPFDPDNLTPDPVTAAPFSFDPHAPGSAAALERSRREQSTSTDHGQGRRDNGLVLPGLLPARTADDLTLADLTAFFVNPTRGFLHHRLDIASPFEEEMRPDSLPIELDGLQSWAVGERLVGDLLAGKTTAEAGLAESQRGTLPPAALGRIVLSRIGPIAGTIANATERLLGESNPQSRSIEIDVDLGDGRRLGGIVPGVFGTAFVVTSYSNLSAKHRLEAWLALLALSAGAAGQRTGDHWTAHVVAKWGKGSKVVSSRTIAADLARTFLRDLVELRDLGLRQPLAFAPKTSFAYAETLARRRVDATAMTAAVNQWMDRSDNNDASIALLYGPHPDLDIWLEPPLAEERWHDPQGLQPGPTRLAHTAMRVWEPALHSGLGA